MAFKGWRRPSKGKAGDWNPDSIHKLDPKVIQNLPPEVLRRLPPDKLRDLPMSTLTRLPTDCFENAPPGVLSLLPVAMLAQLSPRALSSLPAEDLRRLPMDSLIQLPPESLARLPPETLARLPPETLARLPPETLARLPPSAIPRLPPDVLSRLDNLPLNLVKFLPLDVLRHLPRSLLAKLSTESLKRLPLEILSDLPPTATAKLPPEKSSNVMLASPVEEGSQSAHQHQPQNQEQEHDTGVTGLAVPGELGRSKTVSHFVSSMRQRSSEGTHDKGAANVFPKIDNKARIAQKRASYRHLRHPSREEALHATMAPGSGISGATQASNLQEISPLGALIEEAKDLRRVPERRNRSEPDGPRRSPSISEPTQKAGPVPPPKRPLSPDRTLPISSPRHSPNAGLPQDESRVPSSGSHKSVQRQRSLGIRPADDKPAQSVVEGSVDEPKRPVSFDSRTPALRLSDGPGSSKKEPDPTRSQIPPSTETQLKASLRERDKIIFELQEAREYQTSKAKHFMAQLTVANHDLQRQKDEYEKQLADMRNKLASEQARQEQNVLLMSKSHEEKLNNQESSHQQRTKQLKLELLAQKSNYDKRLQEERDGLQAELEKARQELEAVKRKYETQLQAQKSDVANERAAQEREMRRRVAQHQAQLASLEQKHKTNISVMAEKLATQATAHEQQVAILNGQLEEQDADYRLQISQLIEKHADEIQKQRKDHQVELDAHTNESSAYLESLGRQYEAQVRLERDHHQQEMQAQADGHRNAMQQQSMEHSRMLESLRAESGDYIRQASDDKLKGMFRQLKVAVEVVAEPFNLGLVVIQPGSRLDPAGILGRERGMQRHLLRSLVWSKIADGFFSAPFGFGALGNGDGKQMLFELFVQWRKLLPAWQNGRDGLKHPEASDASSLDLYDLWRDRESNRWRSATFQSILALVTARRDARLPYFEATPALDSPYLRNGAAVREEILGLLNEATNDPVGKEIEEKVEEVTSLAAELALEMGVHRAYLGLRFPKRGEKVAIGRDFIDCEDGDPAHRLSEEVELVVCPQFFKVGDGRSDLTTSKSIFRGEIYRIRDHEDDACS